MLRILFYYRCRSVGARAAAYASIKYDFGLRANSHFPLGPNYRILRCIVVNDRQKSINSSEKTREMLSDLCFFHIPSADEGGCQCEKSPCISFSFILLVTLGLPKAVNEGNQEKWIRDWSTRRKIMELKRSAARRGADLAMTLRALKTAIIARSGPTAPEELWRSKKRLVISERGRLRAVRNPARATRRILPVLFFDTRSANQRDLTEG